MKICILGMGSHECKALEQKLKNLLEAFGNHSTVSMSDDIDVFLKHGIKKTPALLVDEVLIHNEELENIEYLTSIIEEHINKDDEYHKAS